jgi:hydrogenase nickel incorporation protein HypA/HybF
MHEMSIASEIIRMTQDEMQRQRIESICAVGLRVGALSGVDPGALTFCFETAVSDTPLTGAKLEVEFVPARGRCRSCGHEFEAEDFLFLCSKCDSRDVDMLTGQELDIVYLSKP